MEKIFQIWLSMPLEAEHKSYETRLSKFVLHSFTYFNIEFNEMKFAFQDSPDCSITKLLFSRALCGIVRASR